MKVYLIMKSNGYGNTAVNSIWATKTEADEECNRLIKNQERYDNHYYCIGYDLNGNIGEMIGNKYVEKLGELVEQGKHYYECLKW